jgi:serine/threonine-protein kinase RsbW
LQMNNSIKVNCTKKNLKLIRDFVTEYLNAYALSDILLNQIVLAVDEICANLIIHANQEDPSKFIVLQIQKIQSSVNFEIADNGIAFNQTNYREPNIQEYVKIGKKGGVGIALVNRIMDRVEFKTVNGRNICYMSKEIN